MPRSSIDGGGQLEGGVGTALRAGLEDLVGEVLGRVGARVALDRIGRGGGIDRLAAGSTEAVVRGILVLAGGTGPSEWFPTAAAEAVVRRVLVAAARAVHSWHSRTTLPRERGHAVLESQ